MTMQEWLEIYNEHDYYAESGAGAAVFAKPGTDKYRDLFGLSDYIVSTVGTGMVWLISRPS